MTDPAPVEDPMRDFLHRAEALGAFPAVATSLLKLGQSAYVRLQDLQSVIERDPGLSAKLVRVANSPLYGLVGTVSSVQHAVMVLGYYEARNLALGLALASAGHPDMPLHREVWSHSLRVAGYARALAEALRKGDGGTGFLAGLMHDLGRLIFLALEGRAYARLTDDLPDLGTRLLRAETQAYGFDHAMLAGACLQAWQIPSDISTAVRDHHGTSDHPLTRVVRLSDALADRRWDRDELFMRLTSEGWVCDALTDDQLAEVCYELTAPRFSAT